jgi:hypothetical protein
MRPQNGVRVLNRILLINCPGRRKPSLGLPEEQNTLHLGAQQVIMGQLSLVGLCRRNTTSRVEE